MLDVLPHLTNCFLEAMVVGTGCAGSQSLTLPRHHSGAPGLWCRSNKLAQLLMQLAAPQFKALDQVLQTYHKETGQKEAISYKCIDIDRMVPQLMGVSKVLPSLSTRFRWLAGWLAGWLPFTAVSGSLCDYKIKAA